MLPLNIQAKAGTPLRVLCLGAHPDDIEIGCGGTILRLAREYPDMRCTWVVFSGSSRRKREAQKGATLFLEGVRKPKVSVLSFKDGYFPYEARVKEAFERIKRSTHPDIVFTHYRDDRHQDHRTISDLTWNTFRDHMILEYEVPKYDGDLGVPNFFVALDEASHDAKVRFIEKAFASQRSKPWFTRSTLEGLARLRGIECREEQYAEAFYARKILV